MDFDLFEQPDFSEKSAQENDWDDLDLLCPPPKRSEKKSHEGNPWDDLNMLSPPPRKGNQS